MVRWEARVGPSPARRESGRGKNEKIKGGLVRWAHGKATRREQQQLWAGL